ncbi:MAG: DNA repair exonuclease [Halanaerobiaceae bacterium]|nr:DNA repair exonuclease [Halanaerobiaceae bacterium]
MRKIKFIHTADLHLGSRLSVGGKYSGYIAEILDNAIYSAFERVCDQAISNDVDFILISGDLYDQDSRSVKANQFFNTQCERLLKSGISVYLIAGNHDPLSSYRTLLDPPENIHIFSQEEAETKKVYDKDGEMIAAVSGFSYKNRAESRKLHLEYEYIPGVWNIGLLHTQLELSNNNYVPASLTELMDMENINYWALGHIHKYSLLHKARNRAILFPGTPQGRNMNEEGACGAVLVEMIPESEPEISFLKLSPVIYHRIEIPIDSIINGNVSDIQNIIINISNELLARNFNISLHNNYPIDGFIVDWVLSGRGEISRLIKKEKEEIVSYLHDYLQKELLKNKPFIWTRKIIDRTGFPIDEQLIQNNPIFNNLEKICFLLKENPQFRKELLEELGLIWTDEINHEEEDYTRFELNDYNLQVILEQARQVIIEELLSRRESS